MITFWLIAAVLVVAVVGILLPAALRAQVTERDRNGHRALHARRLAELRSDIDDCVLDRDELNSAEDEITRALLEEADSDIPVGAPAARWLTLATIALGIPAIALFAYAELGQPGLAVGETAAVAAGAPDQQSIDAMLASLEQRLEATPDSAEGWLLLGRSYMALGRYPEALKAMERAYALTGEVPQVMLQYADALAMTNNGRMGPLALSLVERALVLEPDNIAALWLAGLGAAESGRADLALERLQKARLLIAARGEPTTELDAIISGIDPSAAPGKPAAAGQATIKVRVELDPGLADSLRDSDVLFVFARAPGAEGAPPLAVTRAAASVLPADFDLDETMAMAPQFRLRPGDVVEVTARISRGGEPAAAPGDLQGRSGEVTVGQDATVRVVISETLE